MTQSILVTGNFLVSPWNAGGRGRTIPFVFTLEARKGFTGVQDPKGDSKMPLWLFLFRESLERKGRLSCQSCKFLISIRKVQMAAQLDSHFESRSFLRISYWIFPTPKTAGSDLFLEYSFPQSLFLWTITVARKMRATVQAGMKA